MVGHMVVIVHLCIGKSIELLWTCVGLSILLLIIPALFLFLVWAALVCMMIIGRYGTIVIYHHGLGHVLISYQLVTGQTLIFGTLNGLILHISDVECEWGNFGRFMNLVFLIHAADSFKHGLLLSDLLNTIFPYIFKSLMVFFLFLFSDESNYGKCEFFLN